MKIARIPHFAQLEVFAFPRLRSLAGMREVSTQL
jgi:hypothetical protein